MNLQLKLLLINLFIFSNLLPAISADQRQGYKKNLHKDSLNASNEKNNDSTVYRLNRMLIVDDELDQYESYKIISNIDIEDLAVYGLPGNARDLSRTISDYPSVSSKYLIEDNSLRIRGGYPLETAYLIDGIELHNINHFSSFGTSGGAKTVISPDIISDININTGILTANYPSKSSGAIDFKIKDGNPEEYVHGINIDLTGSGFCSEGPVFNNSSYLLNVRVADYRALKSLLENNGIPRYIDGTLKISTKQKNLGKLSLAGIFSKDDFKGQKEKISGYTIPVSNRRKKSEVFALGTNWYLPFKNKFQAKLHFSASSTAMKKYIRSASEEDTTTIYLDWEKKTEENRECPYYTADAAVLVNNTIDRIESRHMNIKSMSSFSYSFNDYSQIDFGFTFLSEKYALRTQNGVEEYYCTYLCDDSTYNSGDFKLPSIDEIINNDIDSLYCDNIKNAYDKDSTIKNNKYCGYLQFFINPGNFSLNSGIRTEYYTLFNKFILSPHFSASYNYIPLGRFSAGASFKQQLQAELYSHLYAILFNLSKNENMNLNIESFEFEKCLQFDIEFARKTGRYHNIKMSSYFKNYFNRYTFSKPEKYDYNISYNNNIKYLVKPEYQQRTYGIELSFTKDRNSTFFYGIHGTAYNSKRQYSDGKWHYTKDGTTRRILAFGGIKLGSAHRLSVKMDCQTGRRYSNENDNPNDTIMYSSDFDYNSKKLAPLYIMSAKYSLDFSIKSIDLILDIEAVNILNQEKVIDRTLTQNGYYDKFLDGFIPLIGLKARF